MKHKHQINLHSLYGDVRLAELLDTLDRLHTAASEGNIPVETALHETELVGWLCELAYVAQETLIEIETRRAHLTPVPQGGGKIIVLEQPPDQRQM